MTRLYRLTTVLGSIAFLLSIGCNADDSPTGPSSLLQSEPSQSSGSISMGESSFLDDAPGVEGPEEFPQEQATCARSPGFFCQNQYGKNPNMTDKEFQGYAARAALILVSVEGLDTAEEVAFAICDTSDQLFRHLATLALNIAAGWVDLDTPHMNADYPKVGDALAHAIAIANGSLRVTRDDRKEVKRMIEQINENVSINDGIDCTVDDDDDDDNGTSTPTACSNHPDPKNLAKILICHKGKNTLSISLSAWPAHQAHEDTCGPCSGS